jgi:hypothetical protein
MDSAINNNEDVLVAMLVQNKAKPSLPAFWFTNDIVQLKNGDATHEEMHSKERSTSGRMGEEHVTQTNI